VITVIAAVALAVPTIGSFVPVPPFPVDVFPYIFLAWMVIGGSWLFILSRRNRTMFAEIETDLEATMAASVLGHEEDMGTINLPPFEPPLAPTFEELDLALEGVS
jgi:hypothetical protein